MLELEYQEAVVRRIWEERVPGCVPRRDCKTYWLNAYTWTTAEQPNVVQYSAKALARYLWQGSNERLNAIYDMPGRVIPEGDAEFSSFVSDLVFDEIGRYANPDERAIAHDRYDLQRLIFELSEREQWSMRLHLPMTRESDTTFTSGRVQDVALQAGLTCQTAFDAVVWVDDDCGVLHLYANRPLTKDETSAWADAWFVVGNERPDVTVHGASSKDALYWSAQHGGSLPR